MPAGLIGDSGEASKNRLCPTGDSLGVGTGELCGVVGRGPGWWAGARCVARLGSSAGSRRGLLGGAAEWEWPTGRGWPTVRADGDEWWGAGRWLVPLV